MRHAAFPVLCLLLSAAALPAMDEADFVRRCEEETAALVTAMKALRTDGALARQAILAMVDEQRHPQAAIKAEEFPKPTVNPLALHAHATSLEREACRRYADLLLCDTLARGGHPDQAPGYPSPERIPFTKEQPRKQEPGKLRKKPKRKKKAVDLALDEAIDELMMEEETLAFAVSELPGAMDRLADLAEMRRHVETLAAAAKAWTAPPETAPAPDLFPEVADAHFGPWWSFRPLDGTEGAPNRIPADAGGPGDQDWRHVDAWQVFGPVPVGAPARRTATLPHAVYLPRATYAVRDLPGSSEKKPARTGSAWEAQVTAIGTGMLRPPPQWGPPGGYGGLACGSWVDSAWYATAAITCETDQELWFAAGADDDGLLWLDGKLVAAWPEPDGSRDMENPILFKRALGKGTHRVLVRVRHVKDGGSSPMSGTWLKVCLKGEPLAAAAAKARDAKLAARTATLKPFPDTVRGWRGNWLGVEKDVTPPTAWDIEKDVNVRWRSGAPWTISTPVISGQHVIITADPWFVACLDKQTGELRWKQPVDVLELCAPEVSQSLREPLAEYFDLYRAIHDRAEMDDRGREGSITVGGKTTTRAEAWERCREITKTFGRTIGAPLEKAGHVPKYLWQNYMGPICATPVTDGKQVWAWTSHGAAACFDLATGDRRWLVELPHQGTAYGAFSSPLLVDGKLILEVVPDDTERPGGSSKGGEHRAVFMLALDAATGKELWRTRVHEPISSASPIATRITDGEEDMTVLVTGGSGARLARDGTVVADFLGGTVVRADDGKVLIGNLGVNCGYGTPVAVGDIVYHCGKGQMTATRLVMRDRDTLGAVRLWTQHESRGFEPCVAPLGGYLYADLAGGPGGQGDAGYAVYDATTGHAVQRQVNLGWPLSLLRSSWGGSGRKYSMTAIGGGVLFAGDSGEAFGGKKLPWATFTAIEAKPQGRMLARNHLPPRTNSTLAFDGDAIFYRNTCGVICLGITGDEGRKYEAVQNARFLMEDLDPERPGAGAAVQVAALPRAPHGAKLRPLHARPSPSFYVTGAPAPGGLGARLAAVTADPAFVDAGRDGRGGSSLVTELDGQAFTLEEYAFSKHSWPHHPKRDGRVKGNAAGPMGFGKNFALTADKPSQYYAVLMRCGSERTVRFVSETRNPNVKAWLGGVALEHQGRYRVPAGVVVLVCEITAPDGDVSAPDLCMDFRLVAAADDPAADIAAWQEDLKGVKPYLDKVVALAPESEEAKRAREFLGLIE